jgi:L-rhamnose mutarotase
MQRICFVLQVKPGRLAEYKERHRAVWQDMKAALAKTDFERARAGMDKREVNGRWQREMTDFFIQPNGVLPDRSMQPLEEIFHL